MSQDQNSGNNATIEQQLAPETPEMETADESTEEQSDSSPQPEQKQAAQEVKKLNKLKLKVYGEEIDEDLPFDLNESPEAVEYLTKQLQLAKASQRAMQENSTFKSQVEQFFKGFKSDTKAALLEMGIDPKKFAAEVIEEEIKKSQLSPEQRELEELKAEKKKYEEERKKEKEEAEKREYEREQAKEYERIDTLMTSALDKSSLPKEPYIIKKIADYMMAGLKQQVDLSPEDVLPLVEDEIKKDIQSLIRALGEDKVEEFVGKDIFNKIRKKNIAKAKQTPATVKSAIKDVGASSKSEPKASDKQSIKDFFKI